MKLRQSQAWLRFATELHIRLKHPLIDATARRYEAKKWPDRLAQPRWWPLTMLLTIMLLLAVAWLLSGVDFRLAEYKDYGALIDQRTSNLCTISGMGLAVAAFLMGNIAIKEPYAYQLLFIRVKLYHYLFFILTSLGCFALLSLGRNKLPKELYPSLVAAGNVFFVLVLGAIGMVFSKAVYYLSPVRIDELMNRELELKAAVIVKAALIRSLSEDYFTNLMAEQHVEAYLDSENYYLETLLADMTFLSEKPTTAALARYRYLKDINVVALRHWLGKRGELPLSYRPRLLDQFADPESFFLVNAAEGLDDKVQRRLKKLLVWSRKAPRQIEPVTLVRAHFDEKAVEYAGAGKAKELKRILEGLSKLYSWQAEHQPKGDGDLTAGLMGVIGEAIDESIRKKHYRCFRHLLEFCVANVGIAFQHLYLPGFVEALKLQGQCYPALVKRLGHADYQQFDQDVDRSVQFHGLLYAISSQLRTKSANVEELSRFAYQSLKALSDLLRMTLEQKDLSRFRSAVQPMGTQVFEAADYRLHHQIRNLQDDNEDGRHDAAIAELEAAFGQSKVPEMHRRRALFGVKAWLIHLKHKDVLTQEDALKFCKLIALDYREGEDHVNDLFFYRMGQTAYYFGWQNWRLPLLDGEAEKLENPPEWLTFAFMVENVIDNHLPLWPVRLDDMKHVGLIRTELNRIKQQLLDKYAEWSTLLGVKDKDDLVQKADRVINFFRGLETQQADSELLKMAEAEFDPELVDQFRRSVNSGWETEAHMFELFKQRGNLVKAAADSRLAFVGKSGFDPGNKIFFVDPPYIFSTHPLQEYGRFAGRQLDEAFISKVFVAETTRLVNVSIIQLIRDAIQKLKDDDVIADCIIIQSAFAYLSPEFMMPPAFTPNYQMASGFTNKAMMGTFDGIQVFRANSELLHDQVVVADFKRAFQMEYREVPGAFEEMLQADVELVTPSRAEEIYEQEHELPKSDIARERRLLSIRRGVDLQIGVRATFKVIDPRALVIGRYLLPEANPY